MAKIKSGFPGERAIILPNTVVQEFRNDDLGKLLFITDIGFYPKAGYHFRKRTANEALQYILMYCIDGEDKKKEDENNQRLSTGQVVILTKNISISYEKKGNIYLKTGDIQFAKMTRQPPRATA